MHTFFINTSKQELNIFDEIFDISREVRELITLSCTLDKWMDEESGYKNCVQRMGELIDSYQDVTNNFNLIVYVDMIAFQKYSSLPLDEHRTRRACIDALHTLIRHYIYKTLVKELEDVGRKAQSILVIFEENEMPNDSADPQLLKEYVWEMTGMPDCGYLLEFIEKLRHDENKAEMATEDVLAAISKGFADNFGEPVVKDIAKTYEDEMEIIFEELCQNALNAVDALKTDKVVTSFYEKVAKQAKEDSREVCITSFVTHRYAESQTVEMRTKRIVELDLFLLQCVEEQSVSVAGEAFGERIGRKFSPVDWDAVTELLEAKLRKYNRAYRMTESMSEKYSDIGLAPVLYGMDNERFGLDEFGNQLTKAVLVTVEDEEIEKDKKEDKEKKKEKRTHKESRIQKVESAVRLDGYTYFDPTKSESSTGKSVLDFLPDRKTSPEVFKQKAQELRLVHLRYLDSLKAHVGQVLSNYAGRSVDNDAALLKKRDISVPEVDYEPVPAVINYSETRIAEERSSKVAHDVARNGYANAQQDYFEFYASRSVSLTDVEEPCNWLINKVDEITVSLRKIKTIYFALLAALVILYIPFFVLQWEEIIYNAVSVVTALVSVLIPLALLTLVYFVMREIQKIKYLKVWKEFKTQSEKIIAENDVSTEKYDKLLATCIPKLRWLYEYVTDVEFYRDCCEIARAKLEHHAFKQKDYASAIGNVLEDLQRPGAGIGSRSEIDPEEIDFGSAFCAGEKNCRFYSIVTAEELKTLYKAE